MLCERHQVFLSRGAKCIPCLTGQCISFISNNGKVEVTVWSLLQFFTYYLHSITKGEVSDNKRYLTLARPGTTTQIDVWYQQGFCDSTICIDFRRVEIIHGN